MIVHLFSNPDPLIDILDILRIGVTAYAVLIVGLTVARAIRISDYRQWALWTIVLWTPVLLTFEVSQFGLPPRYTDIVHTLGLVTLTVYLVGARKTSD